MHVEEVDGNLDSVALADLVDWLDVRPVDQLLDVQVLEPVGILELLELLHLFLLILVHPNNAASTSGFDIEFVVSAVLSHLPLKLVYRRDASLLTIGR